jgi:hypothetical protein
MRVFPVQHGVAATQKHRQIGVIRVLASSVMIGLATTTAAQTSTQAPPSGPIGWPPKLEVGQVWGITIEDIGTWELRLTGRDTDGDPVGTARAQTSGLTDRQAFFYFKRTENLTYLALKDSTTITLCTFGSGSVQGPTMFGATFTRNQSDTAFKSLENVCIANLDPLGQLGININPPTNPNSLWPPRLSVGQTWRVHLADQGVYSVVLNGTDKDGDPVGTARPASGPNLDAFFYFLQREQNAVLQLTDGTRVWGCVFEPGSLKGSTLTGTLVVKSGRDASFETTGKVCTATLETGPSVNPSSPAASGSGGSSPAASSPPPAPTQQPGSTASQAVWPPLIAVGQIWTVDLGNTRYDVALTRLTNNKPSGPATTPKIRAEASFSFDARTNRATLEIVGAALIQVCTFDAKSPKGAGYVGTVSVKSNPTATPRSVAGTCVATPLRPGMNLKSGPETNLKALLESFRLVPDDLIARSQHRV